MTFKAKKAKLQDIYGQFERDAYEFKKHAICKIGCTYCCTDVGNVDITTLEGLIIRQRINTFPHGLRSEILAKLAQNRADKENQSVARCALLTEDDTCRIYDVRPFSCRQLYSVRTCRGRGPTVHRQAVALAKKAVREIQQLDDTGYSGHLSFILYLLDRPEFRKLYLAGGFDPGGIMEFGKAHGIVINRFGR